MKLSRRFQVLPCRAFCVTEGIGADDCAWMAEVDGDHAAVHGAAAGHPVKVIMTRTVTLAPAEAIAPAPPSTSPIRAAGGSR